MKVTATRRLQFCAGHRVHQHESKCGHLHGHNYVVFLTAEGIEDPLDPIGRVVDFAVLKERIGTWIDQHLDHGFMLARDDEEAVAALAMFKASNGAKQKLFLMPYNPTAENIARYLLEVVGPLQLAGTGCRLTAVVVWETENCLAEVAGQPRSHNEQAADGE